MVLFNPREYQEQQELQVIKKSLGSLALHNMSLNEIVKSIWSEYQSQIYEAVNNRESNDCFIDPSKTIVVLDEIDRFTFRDVGSSWDQISDIRILASNSEIIFPYNSTCKDYPKFYYFVANEMEKSDLLSKIKSTPVGYFSETESTTPNDKRIYVAQKQLFTTGYRGISLGQEVSFEFWQSQKKSSKEVTIRGRVDHIKLKYFMGEFKEGLGTLDDSVMGYSFLSLWNGAAVLEMFRESCNNLFYQRTNCIIVPPHMGNTIRDSLLKIPCVELSNN